MADEPADVRHRELHAGKDLHYGWVEMRGDEIGNGAAKDHAKTFGIDAPAHDAERIGPKVLAGVLDPRRPAITGAQDHRSSAVAEQADGNDVGLGEFVVTNRKRPERARH